MTSHFRKTTWAAIVFGGCMLLGAESVPAADFMFRARVDGKMVEGKPLHWSKTQMLLLGRDGALHQFDPRQAKQGQKTAPRFVGYEMRIVKRALYEEFGDRFDLSTTKHYIVVHPRGQRDLWAQRFEDLYRSFCHYFKVRGFRPQEPKYPLVAVVFRNEAEYYAHAKASGEPLKPGFLGHYDPTTNRVFLFDITGGKDGGDWSANADTIIHEATHQTAYNVGIHTRFTGAPHWVVEGLATMFEAPGVWDSRNHQSRSDRYNRGRLKDFTHHVVPNWKEGMLKPMVAQDNWFKHDLAGAYAAAWAFSFYLCETQPRKYCQLLERTADHPMFDPYPSSQRIADFEKVFGKEWRMMEVKFLRWMEEQSG